MIEWRTYMETNEQNKKYKNRLISFYFIKLHLSKNPNRDREKLIKNYVNLGRLYSDLLV